jgi:TetR/AcrR family transcriptional repressor of nem operon
MMGIMGRSEGRRAEAKRHSRERILDAGAKRLCAEGLSGAAIAPIMRDADLTHGAFYSHFSDKDDLARASLAHAVEHRTARLFGTASDDSWTGRLQRIVRRYLSRGHRDNAAEGCAFAALTSEAGRAPSEFRAAYQQQLRALLASIAAPFDGSEENEKHYDDAIVLMALCVGGLSLARAVPDPEFSDRILRACRDAYSATLYRGNGE